MINKKVSLVIFFVFCGMLFTSFFWKNALILSLILVATEIIKNKIIPIRKEFLWFILSGFIGTSVESFIMLSGAWSYGRVDLLNIPLWLYFLWGLAGCLGVSLYEFLVTNKK